MQQIQLMLVPEPGKAPQALATLQVVNPSPAVSKVWDQVHTHSKTVVLEGYTRDSWAWKPSGPTVWTVLVVESVDGRKKLPGFNKYLKDRQKCAYGRFLLGGTTGIWVVSYVQKPTGHEDRMECRISLDLTKIPGCTLSASPPKSKGPIPAAGPSSAQQTQQQQQRKRAGAGLLGKLVGAQKKTNQHVLAAQAPSPSAATATATRTTAGGVPVETKTAANVLADFRNDMEQKMLDFDVSAESELRVPISLAEYVKGLSDDDKSRVTMEVLKYMVYEAAEEVNEEWIAHKEPSEFMDEITIVVYKEGCAPPEVLEEINKGELPDEVRAQQRNVQVERARQLSAAERKREVALESGAHAAFANEDADDVEALNTKKRDRRTVADYEREKKKGRV